MDEAQYASGHNLPSELQSYSYGVALGAGQNLLAHNFALPDLVGAYPLPSTWAVNNSHFSPAQVISPFQHRQFPTPINSNDDQYSNVYQPWQPSPALPLCYTLGEEDPLAPSTRVDQSGNTFFSTYDVGNAFLQSYVPLLSHTTPLGLPIDATADVFVGTQRATFIGETSNESPHDLHGPNQTPEPNICQERTQSFPSTTELERHAKSLHHNAFECKCGKTYASLDILKRHCDQTPKFPCPRCNRYTGANAFGREDHLTQHLRIFHRINNLGDKNGPTPFYCTWPNCSQQQLSFGSKSQHIPPASHPQLLSLSMPYPRLCEERW